MGSKEGDEVEVRPVAAQLSYMASDDGRGAALEELKALRATFKPLPEGYRLDRAKDSSRTWLRFYRCCRRIVMRVSKWGEDLAVRLPVAMVQDLQLHEGDEVELVAVDGRTLELRAVDAGVHSIEGEELRTDEAEEAKRRAEAIAGLRALARPFPSDFRFNREEANARGRDVEP